MLDLGTPSSPHFTSGLTIFATLIKPNEADLALMPPSVVARSSPSLSSASGRDSLAEETSTVTPRLICEEHSLPLPDRSQFNRLLRFYADAIEEIAVKLGQMLKDEAHPYQALDSSAMPVRDAKRRGAGWLCGYADIGWSNSIGWYEGFSLLSAVEPSGVITGFCFGSASTADQPLAETFFAVRAAPNRRLLSVGEPFSGTYVADKGFEGVDNHRRWLEHYGAEVIHPPKRNSPKLWSKRLRGWIASIRQIVETVYEKLFNTFGLWKERPHEIGGLRAQLAARVALHNFCIYLNDELGRPRLSFADLMGW